MNYSRTRRSRVSTGNPPGTQEKCSHCDRVSVFLAGNASYDAPNFWHQTLWREKYLLPSIIYNWGGIHKKHQSDLRLPIRAVLDRQQITNVMLMNEAIYFHPRPKLRPEINVSWGNMSFIHSAQLHSTQFSHSFIKTLLHIFSNGMTGNENYYFYYYFKIIII